MSLLEIILDILNGWLTRGWLTHEDQSIVGKSPMEQNISRFWQRIWFVLLLCVAIVALYVWLIAPPLSHSASHTTSPTKPLLKERSR